MADDVIYHVLNLDNAEFISEFTGIPVKDLLEVYRKSINFNQKQVYWKKDSNWFTVTVDGKYVGLYDRLSDEVLDLLQRHSQMILKT